MNCLTIISILVSLISNINGLEFCDALKINNNKVLIYSADNKNLFLFIDKYYWIITERFSQMKFKRGDSQAYGSKEWLSNDIATIFHHRIQLNATDDFSEERDSFVPYIVRKC